MATHSSILAWRIPWAEEPGGLHHGVAKNWTGLNDCAHKVMLATYVPLGISRMEETKTRAGEQGLTKEVDGTLTLG